jgi:hydroxyacylglutathione hydrolase
MRVVVVPCLQDNYAYLVVCERTGRAAIVDPSEAAPVMAAVEREGVTLEAIWNTHHHFDHVGGNEALAARFPGLRVVASAYDGEAHRVPAQTEALADGGETGVGELRVRALHVPGHTLGAITLAGEGAAFTGDTLFLAGCGRLFEGSAAQMHASFARLGALPDDTRVYPGHEYTVKNLEFAMAAEPDNADVRARLERARATRAAGAPTVPARLSEERATNPFMRASDSDEFARLREWKDRF